MNDRRFPGETPAYRSGRDELLAAERELRSQVERVAAMRRKLPFAAPVPQDYPFDEGPADLGADAPASKVRLSELFAAGQSSLLLYNFMFSDKMERACPMCTSFLDGLNGNAHHITQRASLAVVAKTNLGRLREFARSRGWTRLRLLSSHDTTFNHDYLGEDEAERQNTMMHVFVKRDGTVHHWYASELNLVPAEPGQNQRHIDSMWPLWNALDLTPEGRGTDWFPKLSY